MTRFKILQSPEGLALRDTYSRQKPLVIDFIRMERRLEQAGRRSELIVQAVRPRQGLKVMDCTAGLGTDALILAYLGCEVTLIERSQVMAGLLDDAIKRARQHQTLADAVARLHLVCAEARSLLGVHPQQDVVYLDPMFPVKSGGALARGRMQLLQKFVGPDHDSAELLDAVLASGVKRTVLKRPPKGSQWQPPRSPDKVLVSRNTKFEIYLQ